MSRCPALQKLDEKDPVYVRVSKLFQTGWQKSPTPNVIEIFKTNSRAPADSQLLFTKLSIKCDLAGDDDSCGSLECGLCTVLRMSFDIERHSPDDPAQRPFGLAIYNTASSSLTDKYCYSTPWSGRRPRALLMSHVTLGKAFRTLRTTCISKPPQGHDSIITAPSPEFPQEEVMVYKVSAIRPAYVVIYGAPDTPVRTSPARPLIPATVPSTSTNREGVKTAQTNTSTNSSSASHSTNGRYPKVTVSGGEKPASSDHPTSPEKLTPVGTSAAMKKLVNLVKAKKVGGVLQDVTWRYLVLQSAVDCSEKGLASPVMYGDPQKYLNILQELLDDPYIWLSDDTAHIDGVSYAQVRHALRTVLIKVSLDTEKLPVSLFLKDVQCGLREPIGSGSFGDVYRGTRNGEAVALKKLKTYQKMSDAKRTSVKKAFHKEALFWKNLNHPHILPLLGVDDSIFRDNPCMVLPWMPNGDVYKCIASIRENERMTDHALFFQIHRWLREIVDGLAYLHDERIIHADLRGPNILIDVDLGVRIADFGMANFTYNCGLLYAGGPNRWTSPELIDPDGDGKANKEVLHPTFAGDVYSFAIVIIELYTGKIPFDGFNEYFAMVRVMSGGRPPRPVFLDGSQMPDALWDLTCRCWAQMPHQRPKAREVKQQLTEIVNGLS
ncbi:kinase-like domain-containing protein [Cristinia sonorae]|uniref:Kinase-like domain-containing protein n=1 Tax=Cristinia sonorae TaxID=1940300 RepID=A0A8K0XJK1_9AGAR|nr:kinase-like domain-containing protein [Cristinia sonorae]